MLGTADSAEPRISDTAVIARSLESIEIPISILTDTFLALGFYVMPQGRHWGALMAAGLAGVIHDCQGADNHEQTAMRIIAKGAVIVTSLVQIYPQFFAMKMNSRIEAPGQQPTATKRLPTDEPPQHDQQS